MPLERNVTRKKIFELRLCSLKKNSLLFFSDAWRRRRRRRRSGKMDESEMEIPEVHNQGVSSEAKRKIFSALFDEELHDEQEEYDVHPKHAPV